MPASAIGHVVFDIGKVLLHYDPELAYLALIPDAAERRHFLATICSPEWNLEQDRGRGWREAEAQLIARHPQHADAIRAFRRGWADMVPHACDDAVAVYEALIAHRIDVTLLTNFAADTFREARQRFPFLGRARGATVSGEVGVIKPDPAIYALHARSFGLEPARTLFIDDVQANVEAARDAGWQAIRFENARQMRDALAAHELPA